MKVAKYGNILYYDKTTLLFVAVIKYRIPSKKILTGIDLEQQICPNSA